MNTPHIIPVGTLGAGFAPAGTVGRLDEIVEFDGAYFLGLTTFRLDKLLVYVPCLDRTSAIEAWHVYRNWYVAVTVEGNEISLSTVRPLHRA